MTPLLIPIPIPHNPDSAPMTEQGEKVMLGIYILLLFVYFITSAISVIRYYKDGKVDKGYSHLKFWEDYYFSTDSVFIWAINIFMTILNAFILLVGLAEMIANLL